MSDLRMMIEAARALRQRGEPFVVATVVHVDGSSYRRPGARMLLAEGGHVAGSVSGGCLEGELTKKAWWLTSSGAPAVMRYDTRTSEDGKPTFGLGCEGIIDVLLERAGPCDPNPLAFWESCIERQRRGAMATVFESDVEAVPIATRVHVAAGGADPEGAFDPRVIDDCRRAVESGLIEIRAYAVPRGQVRVLIEPVLPPPRLFLFGTGHDAVPVLDIAASLGWEVVVCAQRPSLSARSSFARAQKILVGSPAEIALAVDASDRPLALVMNHNYEQDRDVLAMLRRTRARYIGVLGPKRRTAKMCAEIWGQTEIVDDRLHGPAGLDLGAETPEEIALSMVAEMQASLTRSRPSRLRERSGPIHRTAYL